LKWRVSHRMESNPGPLLSICIPTYNRADTLRQALDSILPQIAARNDVEIVVVDNASDGETPTLVRRYMQEQARVRYVQQPENVGFDRNIITCIEQARGKYVSLFGDDDIALPGAFERVLREVVTGKPAIICLNLYPFRGDDYAKSRGTSGPRQDIVFQNGKEFFMFARLGFLSVLTLKSDYARHFIPKVSVGLGCAHVDIAARIALSMEGPFLFLGTETIAARAPSRPSYDAITSIHIDFAAFLHNLESEGLFDARDTRHMLDYVVKGRLWRDMLRKKCLGDQRQLAAQRTLLYQYYEWHPLFRLYAFFIYLLPRPLLQLPFRAAVFLNDVIGRLQRT
jgi:glycosyltransferase involved in cell wall biosynthesis